MKNKKPGKKFVKSLKFFKNHKKNETVKIRHVKIRNGTNSKKNHNEHKNKTVESHKRNNKTDDSHKRNNKTFVQDHVKRKDLKNEVVRK